MVSNDMGDISQKGYLPSLFRKSGLKINSDYSINNVLRDNLLKKQSCEKAHSMVS